MEVVKEGRIILHLSTGKVDLDTSRLDGMMKLQQQQLALLERIRKEEEAIARVRREQGAAGVGSALPHAPLPLPTLPPEPMPTSPSRGGSTFGDRMAQGAWSSWERGLAVINQTAEAEAKLREEAEKLALAQEHAARVSQKSSQAMLRSYVGIGEGVFRIARATVLLGTANEETFEKMIQGVARVQAAFDIFKGVTQIIKSAQAAMAALAAAEATETAAAIANTSAHTKQAGSMVGVSNAAGLLAHAKALGGLGGAAAAAAGVLGVLAVALVRESEEQERARRATEAHNAAIKAQNEAVMAAAQARNAAAISGFIDATASQRPGERLRQINQEQREIRQLQEMMDLWDTGGPATSEQARLDTESQRLEVAMRIVQLAQEEQQIAAEIVNEKRAAYEVAKQHWEAEKQQSMSLEARLGRLGAIEQQAVKDARDKIKAGIAPSESERALFDRIGLSGIIDPFEAKEARAAGLAASTFEGIEGSGIELQAAAKTMKEAAQAAVDAFKDLKLPNAAELARERDALMKSVGDYKSAVKSAFEGLLEDMEVMQAQVRTMGEALRTNP